MINHIAFFTRKLSLITLIVMTLSGCTDKFEEWNTNKHQATDEMMQYDNLSTGSYFVQMQKNVFPIAQPPDYGDEVYQTVQNLAGDVYSGYMGASGLWFSNSNNTTYALTSEWYNRAFSRAFVGVMPAWNNIKKSAGEDQPQVYAMAAIIKVEALHRTTDMYGPLPYLNFGSGDNPYNSQKDIYYAFFDELDDAIGILTDFAQKNPDATVLEQYDFIYGGNVKNWIKFANSLKLRLAMRIVYADPEKARAEAESAVNHPVGVFTSASEAAVLQHTSGFTYNHPLYIICFNFGETRMGGNMDSYLNGYKDPRISSYFLPASDGVYRGIRNGISITNKTDYSEGPFSRLNIASTTPILWMNPAEVYFLRAEGAIRGWNMGGDAQTMYESGIRTSFTYSGVSGADTYLNDATSLPSSYTDPKNSGNNIGTGNSLLSTITIKWNESAAFETKLERIMTQKWISMFPDGQEAWSEFRRTGYPKVFPVVINNSGGLISSTTQIRRLPFPSTEYQNNPTGVARGTALLGGADNGGTKLWWDKK